MITTSRRYVNSKGEQIFLKRFRGKSDTYVFETEDETKITPTFDFVEYDEEHEAFLVMQSYSDIYEDNRPSTMTDKVYFYVDFNGKPMGHGFSFFLNKYYPIKFIDENIDKDDLWFQGFGDSLRNIGLKLGIELDNRRKSINPNMIKRLENKEQ
ncbi:MAG: hypothetical protein J1F35_00670 [Erysipelotrichales bacterium]|nr:hypothetical protein [Erysipelotrichales bacterium]